MAFDLFPAPPPGSEDRADPQIDRLARQLANAAGEDWDGMKSYPGFERNRWREKAERMLAVAGAN